MKQLFVFLLAFCIPLCVYSQINIQMGTPKPTKYETLDTAVVRVFYEMKSVGDTLKPDNFTQDYMVLEIGEKGVSRFYSDNKRRQDSLMVELIKINPRQIDMMQAMKNNGITPGGDEREIFKNYPSGKITVTDHIVSSDYRYEENLNVIPWQIEPDTKVFLSYDCQKATADFRGRHYEAWFAPDLPLNDGPWKFMGLPGLILSIEDAGKQFSFQAIGIENSTLPVRFPQKDYLKTSRKEVEKIRKRFIENPMKFITDSHPGANISIKMMDENGNEKTREDIKFPYNPIELE
jgi:GLPGLI family protein